MTAAAVEYTPASMRSRLTKGRTESRVYNPETKHWERRDAEGYALRRIVFGECKSPFDLRHDMQEALDRAKVALGL